MRKLNATDKRILELADKYVRAQLESKTATMPIQWRQFHESTRKELATYSKRRAS